MEQGIPPDEPIEHVKPQYVYIYISIYILYISFIIIYYLIIINVFVKWNKEFLLMNPSNTSNLSMFIYIIHIFIFIFAIFF